MKPTIDDVAFFDIRSSPDHGGRLAYLEGGKDVSFDIKRVFYVYGVGPEIVRGRHAHRECRQTLVCLRGSCTISCDDGKRKAEFVLDSPTRGLYLPPSIWNEQRYASPDTVLLIMADRAFEAGDYIRDYAAFLSFRNGR